MRIINTFTNKNISKRLLRSAEIHRRCLLLLQVSYKGGVCDCERNLRKTVNR